MNNHLKGLATLLFATFVSLTANAAAAEKEWNFLVYLNGVNNLDYYGGMNINQMEAVGSNDQMNILVQWGSQARPTVDRLLVQKDSDTQKVTSPIIGQAQNQDMGDYNSLVEFAKWANANYPARHTFIVVWNHGSGWHRPEWVNIKDISWDDRTGHSISTENLGKAMKMIAADLGKPVDIYGSDACLMGMIEVADEMNGAVNYFVGSQDLEPGEGWPYTPFLQAWNSDIGMSAGDVSRLLSKEFNAAYSGGVYGNQSVTMSAFDMSQIGAYKAAVKDLATELQAKSAADLKKIKTATTKSKNFYNSDYIDLIDFLDKVSAASISTSTAASVRSAHDAFVIANDQNQDSVTHGLSIWIPTQSYDYSSYWSRYEKMAFNQNTGWGYFVKKMLGK